MTDQPKTAQLSPEEWKQLCVLNINQLQTHLQNMPAVLEGGSSAMTAERIAEIETHLNRGRTFLNAWARSKAIQVQPAAPVEVPAVNEPPRQKRKYTRRAEQKVA